MSAPGDTRIVLVGGGLAGGLLAAQLGQAGYEVDVYERRPDPAAGQSVGGRSINLAISVRGLHALAEVGLAEEILRQAIPMRGRMIHGPRGELHFQPYDKDPSRHIHSVSRAALNAALIEAARRHPHVRVHFGWKCVDVDVDRPAARFVRETGRGPGQPPAPAADADPVGADSIVATADLLIGVDGAYSAVRRSMQRRERFDYSQSYLAHGYKELSIPPAGSGQFALEPHALHIWPRHSFMMIALPNADRSFTCTLFLPFEGCPGFAALRTREDVRSFFERTFPDAVPLMPTLLDDFERNPLGSMVTVRCAPWSHAGKVVLLGDAAHAVVPFYGQGANAAFEDCTVLGECMRRRAPDWPRVLAEYQASRKPDCDALADLALANFIEMRDKTASRAFRAYKLLDRTLHRLLPGLYTPLYTMVSFTRTPYARAVQRARRQDRIAAAVAITLGAALLALGLSLAGADAALVGLVSAAGALIVTLVVRMRGERARRELRRIGVCEA